MIPRIIALLLVLALASCATVEIPNPTDPTAQPLKAKLVSDAKVTVQYIYDCPPGTELAERGNCPLRPHVIMESNGIEGGGASLGMAIIEAAAGILGAREPTVVNVLPAPPPE